MNYSPAIPYNKYKPLLTKKEARGQYFKNVNAIKFVFCLVIRCSSIPETNKFEEKSYNAGDDVVVGEISEFVDWIQIEFKVGE